MNAALCSRIFFRQLFDAESSTYTYLLADVGTREAMLIDPVLGQIDRDVQILKEMGFDLRFGINTHVHADHITGTGKLKTHFPSMKSVLGTVGNQGVAADLYVNDAEFLTLGEIKLEFRSTPGHTTGCHTLVEHERALVFTGDTLLIRGCGRTDFQNGDARKLYNMVWMKVFTLPGEFFVYPAHDYKGRTRSTISEEKNFNPRLTKSEDEFVEIMTNLNLPYPKMLDIAVPANRVCGVYEAKPRQSLASHVDEPVTQPDVANPVRKTWGQCAVNHSELPAQLIKESWKVHPSGVFQ